MNVVDRWVIQQKNASLVWEQREGWAADGRDFEGGAETCLSRQTMFSIEYEGAIIQGMIWTGRGSRVTSYDS
jgi:hypothetical protein